MERTAWLGIFVAAFAVWRLVLTLYEWQRLRHVKGPWIASISRFWEPWSVLTGRQHQVLLDVTNKYGGRIPQA